MKARLGSDSRWRHIGAQQALLQCMPILKQAMTTSMHTLLITIIVTITSTVVLVIVLNGYSIGKDDDNDTNETGMAMIVCAKSLTPQHLAGSGLPP